jgi:Cd2+/Zn2+-exporting ATPase
MDCPSCGSKIEAAIGRLPSVANIAVDVQGGRLTAEFDETAVSSAEIQALVRSLGYRVSEIQVGAQHEDEPAGPWWQTRKVLLAAAFAVLLGAGSVLQWAAPSTGIYAFAPTILLGIWFYGGQAIAAARAGYPFSIETLMTVAVVGAALIGAGSEAAVVLFLFAVGELLEGVAARRARAGVRALADLVPKTARLVVGTAIREVPASSVQAGHLLLVRPGDRIAADGKIVLGTSAVDESPVTGESMPVSKSIGDRVYAGSVNADGELRVQADRAASDNTIARILHMVEEAQSAKSPMARFIDRFSARYTPAAMAAAALVATLPPLMMGADWSTWIYRSLALLLIACPCALVLSTPAAITSGIAAGARRGLLIKGGAALEAIGRVRIVAFDKTGTLTEGRPQVVNVDPMDGATVQEVLRCAATVEQGSSHPISKAILQRAKADGIEPAAAQDAKAIPGFGASARMADRDVAVVSPRYAADKAVNFAANSGLVAAQEKQGATVVIVMENDRVLGAIAVRDEVRADARAGIEALQRLGCRVIMLTGDNSRTASVIASKLGIEHQADLLPNQKLEAIEALAKLAPVAMVGDGINDAPALAAASVGIAMGGGTDVALETADAAVLHDSVGDIAALVELSRATMRNIRQNVTVALGLKAIFLVTTLAGTTDLWLAILADTGATVLVTMNALRLLRFQPSQTGS